MHGRDADDASFMQWAGQLRGGGRPDDEPEETDPRALAAKIRPGLAPSNSGPDRASKARAAEIRRDKGRASGPGID